MTSHREAASWLLKHTKGSGSIACAVLLIVVASVALSLVSPLLVRAIIDDAIPQGDTSYLLLLVGLAVAFSAASACANFLASYLYAKVSYDLSFSMRRELYRSVVSGTVDLELGDILQRVGGEVGQVQSILSSAVIRFFGATLALVLTVVVLSVLDPVILGLALTPVPLVLGLMLLAKRRIEGTARSTREASAHLLELLRERIGAKEFVGAYQGQERDIETVDAAQLDMKVWGMQHLVVGHGISVGTGFLLSLPVLIALGAGGVRAANGLVSLGTLVAMVQYVSQLVGPIEDLRSLFIELQRGMASVGRVMELRDRTVARSSSPQVIRTDVQVRGLYKSMAGRELFGGLNIKLAVGEKLGVMAPSGAGKSTLLKVLLGYVPPDRGDALMDGRECSLADVGRALVRQSAWVDQSPVVFHSYSLLENLLYGNSRSEQEAADLAEEIGLPPEWLEPAALGEMRASPSRGQVQCIAVARAILRSPRFLILDEATSSMDPVMEAVVLDRALSACGGSVIATTHSDAVLSRFESKLIQQQAGKWELKCG